MAEDNDDTREISLTLPAEWVEQELIPAYPAATRASQALRMSVQNDVKHQRKEVTSGEIADELVELIKRTGGSWENIQRIKIESVEDVEVSDGEISVTEE